MTQVMILDDLCSLIVDCEHKTAPLASSGYPSIRTPNIGRGMLLLEGVNRVDRGTYEAWTKRAVPRANDLIVAREAPVGNVAIVPEGLDVCLGQRTVLIRPNLNKVHPRFLCYYLLGDYVQHRFKSTSGGATVAHLNMRDIRNLPIPSLPSLPIQRRIASILGAYDDLIEVNRRRIAVLEEMARRLFEEWFVHFRFPGHEGHAMVETENGRLPKGWEWAALEAMLVLQRGFDLPTQSRELGTVPLVTASGISGTHSVARIAAPGVVTGRSGTIGGVYLIHEDFWPLNTTLYVKEFRHAKPMYALHLLRNLDLKSRAVGAAVPTLNRNHVHGVLVPCAPPALMKDFEKHAATWLQTANVLERSQNALKASRDLLLPRLISGDLPVSAAEAELEAAA